MPLSSKNLSASVKAPGDGRDAPLWLGIVTLLIFFLATGYISYANTRLMNDGARQVVATHEVILHLDRLLSAMKDAETGQRGFVITGEERYLAPYHQAVASMQERRARLVRLLGSNAQNRERIMALETRINTKFAELAETIALRRQHGFEAARDVVITDRGREDMDFIREQIEAIQQDERLVRERRLEEMNMAFRTAVGTGLITAAIGIVLSLAIATLMRRFVKLQRRDAWMQNGQVALSRAVVGEQRMDQLGQTALAFLLEYFDAQAGAFYVREGGEYRRICMSGVAADGRTPDHFTPGDGLLGRVAREGKAILMRDVAEEYLTIGSALGRGKPRHLLVAPAVADGEVNAVIELGFVHPLEDTARELLVRLADPLGMAVKAAGYRAHLQNLLEETQRQAEELQTQSEELRVNNEELEEQGRALKESQARLEQQQVELEQTNSQLEEQTQMLENQRDDLKRAKTSVQAKARELELASQYKSDFLANMSHELRTPLNSSLILAKLLADNPEGNLTAEQVNFAKTIQSSGNDLLSLINDILDLSKIEAGHMEMRFETITLSRVLDNLKQTFSPIAGQKGLEFSVSFAQGAPLAIESDRQRLEQILKNLLSNAIKFTEKGKVELVISREAGGRIGFTVSDTGIGIAPEQQAAIFDAFRQADGTISRKYGGTGLGLSISRQLARLLGGQIRLSSQPGKGSSFILTLGEQFDPANVAPAATDAPMPAPTSGPRPEPLRLRRVEDDRETLRGDSRIILIVEDDAAFARILYDLVREQNFECLVAETAEEALTLARQYLPSAVVLDVGLPDHSGLSVLDRLKRDSRTRHIPVHVVSASDHAQAAFSMGAVGYMLKPVKREALQQTFARLETRLSQRLRRVLIVEDDPVQQESVRRLLGTHDVETVGASTAAECLAKLEEAHFDCMVLDLSLPDASGYELLEQLSKQDAYSFPPVIVYTGRDLSADEEQRLRRYSKSIIIKGAKSPERLLDEVTLFLHQVVSDLPAEQQRMIEVARSRDTVLEGRRILVVEDDVRNVYAVTSIFEPRGVKVQIARDGREGLAMLEKSLSDPAGHIDLVLMDVMMPEMDGLTATREIRKRPEWRKLPVIMLTAKAMKDDQERCIAAGANDYMAKPLDVEKLLSLVRVWMPR